MHIIILTKLVICVTFGSILFGIPDLIMLPLSILNFGDIFCYLKNPSMVHHQSGIPSDMNSVAVLILWLCALFTLQIIRTSSRI